MVYNSQQFIANEGHALIYWWSKVLFVPYAFCASLASCFLEFVVNNKIVTR